MQDEGRPITGVYRFLVSQGEQSQQSPLMEITDFKRSTIINALTRRKKNWNSTSKRQQCFNGRNNKFTKEHTRTFYKIKMAFIRYTNILFGYLRRRAIFDLWRNNFKLLSVVTRIVSILWTWRRAGDKFIHTRRWYPIGDAGRIINHCAKTDTVRGYDKHSAVVSVRGVCVCARVTSLFKNRPVANAHRLLNFLHTALLGYKSLGSGKSCSKTD
jgi:hypothetical protein